MHRIQFHYTLHRDSAPALVRNPLIDLLQAQGQTAAMAHRNALLSLLGAQLAAYLWFLLAGRRVR